MKKIISTEIRGREKKTCLYCRDKGSDLVRRGGDKLHPRLAPVPNPGNRYLLPAEEWTDNLGCDDIKTPGRTLIPGGTVEHIRKVSVKPMPGYLVGEASDMSKFFNSFSMAGKR